VKKEKKAEVLGLTRHNDQYKNVPDDLKWAIPLIEIQKDPAFIAAQQANYAAIVERVKSISNWSGLPNKIELTAGSSLFQ